MIWRVCGSQAKEAELSLVVSDVIIEWLCARAQDPIIRSLDPYRDSVLNTAMLERWRDELVRIEHDWASEVAAELTETRRLPRDAGARRALVEDWTKRILTSDERYPVLRDMTAAISLALEIGGFIHALGD
jgi:hypothetical protein